MAVAPHGAHAATPDGTTADGTTADGTTAGDTAPDRSESLTVDCDGCVARGSACEDCVVSVLLGPPGPRLRLDVDELSALDALAEVGLVPPLRLVQPVASPDEAADANHPDRG